MNRQVDYALSLEVHRQSKEVTELKARVDNLTDLCIALSAYVGNVNGLDVKNLEEHLDRVRK